MERMRSLSSHGIKRVGESARTSTKAKCAFEPIASSWCDDNVGAIQESSRRSVSSIVRNSLALLESQTLRIPSMDRVAKQSRGRHVTHERILFLWLSSKVLGFVWQPL
jgi:predicted transcriptional regulator